MDIVGYNEKATITKARYVELNAFNLAELRRNQVGFDDLLRAVYVRMFGTVCSKVPKIRLKKELFPFQVEGVNYLHAKGGRVLLADEMGLGKTVQIIGLLSAFPKKYLPVIVISPAHVKLNWLDEFGECWRNDHVEVVFGTKVYRLPKDKSVIVINQHLLKAWHEELLRIKPKYMVIDEAHAFVSKKTQTYQFVEKLSREIGRVALLTGTPLVNKIEDLWGLVNLINPNILGGYTRFINRFCPEKAYDPNKVAQFRKKTQKVWGRPVFLRQEDDTPKTTSDEDKVMLNAILRHTCMLRRLKSKVAKQLPKKHRKVIRIKVESSKFWKAEAELREQIKASLKKQGIKGGVIDMHSFSRMRQVVGEAKFDFICDWIDEWLSDSSKKNKLVVTGWHKDVMRKLHERFPDSYLITGDVSTKKKHAIAQAFSVDKEKRIMFGNLKSIGTGINKLVCADTMVNVELPYTGADLEQVEARLDRLSQKAKHVFYLYFIIAGSLEEKLLQYISRKQKEAGHVIDNREVKTLEERAEDVPNTKLLRKLLLA